MKPTPRRYSTHIAFALCVVAAFAVATTCGLATVSHAQQTGAAAAQTTALRLVAELQGYEGPSAFAGRAALVAFSPDGQTLAVSGTDRTVKLFETTTGKLLATLTGDKTGVNGFAFSPDSRVAATRSVLDHSVSLWDVQTGKLLLTLAGRKHDTETKLKAAMVAYAEFARIPFSPDGAQVLTEHEDDVVVVWDTATGKQLATLEHKTETSAAKDVLKLAIPFTRLYPLLMQPAFGPVGRRIATANGDRAPKLWDASTWQLVSALSGPYDRTYVATLLPGGQSVMTFSIKGEVNIWDAETGAHRATLATSHGQTYTTAVSLDGSMVATQVDDVTTVWDAATGHALASMKKNKARLLAFGPDNRTLVSAGGDDHATARLWDVETGRLKVALAKPDDDTRSIELSSDGRLLLTTSGKGARLWDAETGALISTLERARFPAHFSPDGRRLVTGGTDKTALLYELPAR
ncbi:MAG: hypothetical protein QOE46_2999 [Acidobacteriota bacterium]|jgi:WD40 repeat protein|nr:hypothetical protein [Acidobacteriota bacterium]